MTTIGAYLIVKNEESCLEKCLRSIQGLDEIVIVDTGSTDGTADIARKHTDKYYANEYQWEDSFCKARNYALAKSTTDWVFIIDADEELGVGVDKIRGAVAEAEADGKKSVSIKIASIRNVNDYHLSIRAHRRCPEIRWCGDIHNYLVGTGSGIVRDDIVILAGYSKAHQNDPDRALRILTKVVSDNPSCLREKYYLAREYWYRHDYVEAAKWYREYLGKGKWLPEVADAYLMLARCLWNMRQGEEARKACLQALNINANFKEALLLMAEMSWPKNAERWREFAEHADNSDVLFVRVAASPKKEVYADAVSVCMATIPSRENILGDCVNSLLAQLPENGTIRVCLNGHDHAPDCLDDSRIEVVWSQDVGDFGDAGKFHWLGKVSGYYLSVDDDIVYPPNYIKNIVAAIEAKGRKAVVGYHGILYPENLKAINDRITYACLQDVAEDHGVHALGTGAMAFHTSLMPDDVSQAQIFKTPNMADVWFARFCQNQKIPMISLRHRAGYLLDLLTPAHPSIYAACSSGDKSGMDTLALQLQVINEEKWRVHVVDSSRVVKLRDYDRSLIVDTVLKDNDVLRRGLLFNGRFYEDDLLEFAHQLPLYKDEFIVDVGANVGNHSMFFSAFCACAGVIAFEPYEKVREALEKHVRLNNLAIEVFPLAVGARSGTCDLNRSPNNWDGSTCVVEGTAIPMVALDDAVCDRKISMIKIDVEGYECEVLRGATKILSEQHPYLFVEAKTKPEKDAVDGILKPIGYEAVRVFNAASPTYFYVWSESAVTEK